MKEMPFSDIILYFLFPNRCAFCGKVIVPEQKICRSCQVSVKKIEGDICPACGLPKKLCACGSRTKFCDITASVYCYEDSVRQGVLHYKNGGNKRVVKFFAEEMAECFYKRSNFAADFIVYIPQTKKEKKARGFDQNREIAYALSEVMHIPVYDKLIKLYDTPSQKSLHYLYKQGNVSGVFDLTDPGSVKGKRFILTDDIRTTGATLNECAKILKLYDADRVFALTFAAALPKKKSDPGQKNTQKIQKP